MHLSRQQTFLGHLVPIDDNEPSRPIYARDAWVVVVMQLTSRMPQEQSLGRVFKKRVLTRIQISSYISQSSWTSLLGRKHK